MQRFGFIIHPISVKDMARKYAFASKLPDSWVERAVSFIPPMTASHITGVQSITGVEAEGWFIGVPLTPRLMTKGLPEKKVLAKIIAAGQKAADHGAKIVGLGAFTSVVGDAGVTVARELDIAVTTGNTFTAATALQGIDYAAGLMEMDLDKAEIAVLGASGSIGKACARILARSGRRLTVVARDRGRLDEVASLIKEESGNVVKVETDLAAAVRTADVVVAVTSSLESVVNAADLKSGAIVCDVSRPRNVSKAVAESRRDVLVFEGGVVAVPGNVDFHFNFGFPEHMSYACMAETMILALAGRYEDFSIGRDLDVAKVDEISELAKVHGFRLAGLRSFERAMTESAIKEVKHNAKHMAR